MTLPVETIDALFVADERVGNAVLRPATLAHLAAMDALGVGVCGLVARKDALLAAWVLTLDYAGCVRAVRDEKWTLAAFKAWVAKCGCTADECFLAVNAVVAHAASTYVPGAGGEGDGGSVYSTPHGFGWPLEVAEFLCHEYGWDFARAMDEPLVRVYGLVNCARQRNGGRNGDFDYYERILQRQFKEAKAAAEKTKAEADADAAPTVADGGGNQ